MSELAEYGQKLAASLTEIDDLISGVKDAVKKRVMDFERNAEPAIGKREAAAIIGCCVRTLETKLKGANPPPHYIDGNAITFYASEVRAWKGTYRVGKIANHS